MVCGVCLSIFLCVKTMNNCRRFCDYAQQDDNIAIRKRMLSIARLFPVTIAMCIVILFPETSSVISLHNCPEINRSLFFMHGYIFCKHAVYESYHCVSHMLYKQCNLGPLLGIDLTSSSLIWHFKYSSGFSSCSEGFNTWYSPLSSSSSCECLLAIAHIRCLFAL